MLTDAISRIKNPLVRNLLWTLWYPLFVLGQVTGLLLHAPQALGRKWFWKMVGRMYWAVFDGDFVRD